ncbi:MAG: 4-hydroxy-3-methylbut-2-enyl diphosphate reductase [Chloroflexota bacterium]
MQVERARQQGLCFGVRRALSMLRDAASHSDRIETLGPIAHNRILMRELEQMGIVTVSSLSELSGPTVVISAHGISPDAASTLRDKGFHLVDTTCPIVAKAHAIAAQLAHEGFTIVIFGDSAHTEVRGLLGWAGGSAVASTDGASLLESGQLADAEKIAVIAQTTQPADAFADFAASLCDTLSSTVNVKELRVVNTLCHATRKRLESARELAGRVDLMLVVGGKNSANTQRLAEACSTIVETFHIECADELQKPWFKDKSRVGVTAGASTPDSSIEEVERRVSDL